MVIAAAGIGAAATIGSAALSSSKGGGGSSSSATQTSDSSHTPWGPQGGALQLGLQGATQVYNDRTQAGPYQGQLYQPLNDVQNEAVRSAYGYGGANGMGAQAIGQAGGVGDNGTSQMGQAMANANQTATHGLGTTANAGLTGALSNIGGGAQPVVNKGLSDALHGAATSGANSIGGYNSSLQGVINNAQQDSTGQLISDAQQSMNSGATGQMVANANNQISRTLNEVTNPGLNRQAAMGGSLNSSRAGMAEAMANTDASLSMGNADAQIMNNAYNTGMSTAAQQHTAGLNTAASAASAGLTGNSNLALGAGNQDISATNSQVAAANAGLGQQTSRDTANTAAQLSGNNQLLSGVNTGLNANQQQQQLAAGNSSLLSNAGGLLQGGGQGQLNANHQQWQNTNTYQQGVLNDYMANATRPQGYYNSSASSKSTATPASNYGQLAAGAGVALGGAFAPGGALNKYIGGGDGGSFDGAGVGNGGGQTGGFLGFGGTNSPGFDGGQGYTDGFGGTATANLDQYGNAVNLGGFG